MVALAAGFIRKHDRSDLHELAHAIESQDRTKEHPDRIEAIARLGAVAIQGRLEPARGVIAEKADRATRQRCQAGAPRELLVAEIFPQKLDRVLLAHFSLAVLFDDGLSSAPARNHPGIRPEEAIPSYALAALDRFQQKRVRRLPRNSRERSHQNLEIGEHA